MKQLLLLFSICLLLACNNNNNKINTKTQQLITEGSNLITLLDTIWKTEQEPIRLRDSIGRVFGFESEAFNKQNAIYHKNHDRNEKMVLQILDSIGWPSKKIIGEQGNLTICNVLQHSGLEVREQYLPLMRKAVKDKELLPRFLVRAIDRIATDKNELQIYGGQVKYYPETKSFNVWPIKDPENVNKRRAEMGMGTIEEFLKQKRVPIEWNIEEQLKRTKDFIAKNK